ncbi:hypothetical protein BJ741DRAFT_598473 [Chytriomyces cf. hyalinus JEL632]|nr:hypothetical protein BJ741DRAFT_598473 [Chytriomyces cf. hyalinus JEL632]
MASTPSNTSFNTGAAAASTKEPDLASGSSRAARRSSRIYTYTDEGTASVADNDSLRSSNNNENKRLKNRKAQANFIERKKQTIVRLEARIIELEQVANHSGGGGQSSLGTDTCATVEAIKETVEIMAQKWVPYPSASGMDANKSRRQLQNKHAQQLSRYRRDAYITMLEDKVAQLESGSSVGQSYVKLEMPQNEKRYFEHEHEHQQQQQEQQRLQEQYQHKYQPYAPHENDTGAPQANSPGESSSWGETAAAAESCSDGTRIPSQSPVILPSFSTLMHQLKAMSEPSAS